jgi:AcrR family transcriptional regulator
LRGIAQQGDVACGRRIEQARQALAQASFGGQPGRVVAGAPLQVVTGEARHGISGSARPWSDGRVVQVAQARSLLELIKKHRHAWMIRAFCRQLGIIRGFDCHPRPFLMHKEPRKVREFRRREQEILDTALKLFLEQGEDSVTVEMIADAVGIGKGTIYKHFKSKAEIYLRLMLDYERDLNELLHSADVDKDKEALSRAYFEFRMRDRSATACSTAWKKGGQGQPGAGNGRAVHKIRASNFERLTQLIKGRISEGKLEDVPPYFHYCAAWALVHGAVALYHSPFWSNVLEDQEGFFQFLMDIGVRMGNKRKRDRNPD